jgi:hypothetical protein
MIVDLLQSMLGGKVNACTMSYRSGGPRTPSDR